MDRNIIFVHGFASSKSTWVNQVNSMERFGWKSHAIDLLGHGERNKPADEDGFDIETMYSSFLEDIDKLKIIGQLVFVGHSLGCYLSILHALEYPSKSKGLVLIAPLVNPEQFIAKTAVSLKLPQVGSLFLRLTPFWMIRSFIRNDAINSAGLSDDLINQVALDYKKANPRIVYIGRSLGDLFDKVKHLKCPVSLLWGKKDNTLDPVSFERLRKSINPLNICAISDGGHSIHLTHPVVVNHIIREFLRQVD
jgi:pimeloyl-ACP methyl ester carboxylesterase